MKEKRVSLVSLLRYKLGNIFVGRSMYMQQRTGSFKEQFSKNIFYRFLNSMKPKENRNPRVIRDVTGIGNASAQILIAVIGTDM